MPRRMKGGTGTPLRFIKTKDKMGFNLEALDICDANKSLSESTIWRHRRRDRKVRDELSSDKARRSKNEVTLPKFSWDK